MYLCKRKANKFRNLATIIFLNITILGCSFSPVNSDSQIIVSKVKFDLSVPEKIKNNLNIFSIDKPDLSFYLFWAGFMTLIPLFWYTKGFNLIGIGPASMIFFLTPTAQFILGLFYYNEPLIYDELISFVFIWFAVIIYLNELRKE